MLLNVASVDHSPDSITQYEKSLIQQFGLSPQESAAIHVAGQILHGFLSQPRDLSLIPKREQLIATLANQILGSVRPETASRLRAPGRVLAMNVPSKNGTGPAISNLSDLQDCIGPDGPGLGYGMICRLAPGTYPVQDRLIVARSGIVITGTMIAGP